MDSPAAKILKVMIVTPTLECGGAERFVSLFCNNAHTNAVRLSLVVINNAKPFYTIDPSVPATDLGISRVSRSFFRLRKLIKKEQPDIVFTTANHLNLLAAITRFLLPRNIIWVARESSVASVNSKYARYPSLYDFLLKIFYKKLDHIICQSSFMQDDLVNNYHVSRGKTTVIYNAVDPELQYYEGPVKPAHFLTVARLSAEKGIAGILRTLAQLGVPFHYSIVGDGPGKESLQRLAESLGIEDHVDFAGQQPQPFSGREHNQVYLMGSLYEGFPNAVLEANATGMPVVAKIAPGGIKEIIADGHNGFIASGDNDFRRKILIATTYPFNRHEISDTTRRRFSVEEMLTSLHALFLKLYKSQGK